MSNVRKSTQLMLDSLDEVEFKEYETNHTRLETCAHFSITNKVYCLALDKFSIQREGKGSKTKIMHDRKFDELLDRVKNVLDQEFYNNHSDSEVWDELNIHVKPKTYKKLLEALSLNKHSQGENEKIKKSHLYGDDYAKKVFEKVTKSVVSKWGSMDEFYKWRTIQSESTKLERYGDPHYVNYDKIMEVRRKNGTCRHSKMEEEYYKELLKLYSSDDIIREYNKDPRYPYHCDFYIKSEDLFIECNYFWTHGGHPFNSENVEDLEKIEKWASRANELINDDPESTLGHQYLSAINCWTVYDPEKRKCAEDNNLNYVEVW